ncbi:phiSA1p31-related protein [Streptomyces sp. CACIS-1.16CA]|uniref:phiSA1p31-related protein n=1 Tax=Streptomyces sp. CACIS-1.16CA TaxID=1175510 RepID=UPI0037D9333B
MTTFEHDGVVFDLTIPYADVFGGEWAWAGEWSGREPLMQPHSVHADCQTPLAFTVLYKLHGPLIPISPRPTAAQYRAAVDVDYAATVAAGYVETPAAFGAGITPVLPAAAPQLTAHHLPSSPMEQSGFRRFLNSISGRTS